MAVLKYRDSQGNIQTIPAFAGPTVYIKNASVQDDTLTLTKQDNSTIQFTGGGDLPTASASVKGGVKIGSGLTMTGEVLSANSQTENNYTTVEKNKLAGIAEGAEANPSAFLKNATVSNDTLTITKQDDTTVQFSSSGAQSDWNQNNNVSIDYIKNRTHYDASIVPVYDLYEWDGDSTGLETVTGTYGEIYCKIDNNIPENLSEIFGVAGFICDAYGVSMYGKFVDLSQQRGLEAGTYYSSENMNTEIFIITKNCTLSSLQLTKGIWVCKYENWFLKEGRFYRGTNHTDYYFDGDLTGKTIVEKQDSSDVYVKISNTYPNINSVAAMGVGEDDFDQSYTSFGLIELESGVYSVPDRYDDYDLIATNKNATVNGYSLTPGLWALTDGDEPLFITFILQTTDLHKLDSKYIPTATSSALGGVKIGSNLTIATDGTLSVDTAASAIQDNTKPITSGAVYTEIGNINALLGTI